MRSSTPQPASSSQHARRLRRRAAARCDRAAAREPLRRGLDLAVAASARPLAERARQELTATGKRVRREAETGLAALTPSERRIAEHATATNPEIAEALFITVKTVELHLGNAYRKPDITPHHELARHLRTAAPDSRQRLARPREGRPLVTKSERAGGQARDTRTGRPASARSVQARTAAIADKSGREPAGRSDFC